MPDHNLSPATATMHGPHMAVKHERKSSINSTGMQTPVSTSGPRSPLTPTADAPHPTLTSPQMSSRPISEDRSTVSGDEEPKLKYPPKRPEEPMRNAEGKMTCSHHGCTGRFFERKCEWSKHMDKHDRPYKCTVSGCEKLRGFTYSGGLLRHEREVHKMHGGTKKSLFCPFSDCKRSSGSGFTRKENLAEHIRRVHRRTSMSADMHGLVIRNDMDATATTPVALPPTSCRSSKSPYAGPLDYRDERGDGDGDDDDDDDDDTVGMKRKRGSEARVLSASGAEALRAENKRLRRENEAKELRLRSLEEAFRALQEGRT